MNPLNRLARRVLGLPPRRHRCTLTTEWLALGDGTRLATTLLSPLGPARTAAVVMRTPLPAHGRAHPALLLGRLLAEAGYACVVQECRGRYASEGRFEPFRDEARDGGETLRWVLAQPWCDGRIGLAGFGYAAYTAWAALGAEPQAVRALVVGFGARDPYTLFHVDGALALETALRFALLLGDREMVPEKSIDLTRGLVHRPLREADRVALRRIDWLRDWIDHPVRDDYWTGRIPALPASPPPALLLGGWFEPSLRPLLDDYTSLRDAAGRSGGTPPELVVGPWLAGGRRERGARGAGPIGAALREALGFLDRKLGDSGASEAPVRLFVRGAGAWRSAEHWPVPEAREEHRYLSSGGRANGAGGDGRLEAGPPSDEEPPDRFRYDPADPVPSVGGARFGGNAGAADQRGVESRGDVLCYTSRPVGQALEVHGPVRVSLFAASSAPDTDFTAKLVRVTPDGVAWNLCEGVRRCRWRNGAAETWLSSDPEPLEIELGVTCTRLAPGDRLRLEISSSSFPRFDRNPNTRADPARATPEECSPARQRVFHDAARPSRLRMTVVDGASMGPPDTPAGPSDVPR